MKNYAAGVFFLLMVVFMLPRAAQSREKWLDSEIKKIQATSPTDPVSEIKKCKAGKKILYMIETGCCDKFIPVFNHKGKQLCSTGGFSGNGDGKCKPDYFKNCTTEWKDDRAPQSNK